MIYSKNKKSLPSFAQILRLAKFFDVMYKFKYNDLYNIYMKIKHQDCGFNFKLNSADSDCVYIIRADGAIGEYKHTYFNDMRKGGYIVSLTCFSFEKEVFFYSRQKKSVSINCMNNSLYLYFLCLFICACEDNERINAFVNEYKTDQYKIYINGNEIVNKN